MSKAEEKALEKYPAYSVRIVSAKGGGYYADKHLRDGFVAGYRHAEEDLRLTIEEIKKIHTFLYAVKNNKQGAFTFTRLSNEQYQEVLKRFQDYKERNK